MAHLDSLSDDSILDEDVENFLAYVEGLIDEEHVQYARDTLEGIMETVKKRNHVSDAQWKAVENIDEGGQRGQYRRDRDR